MKHDRDSSQRNLYILNLPLDVSTDQFEELFKQKGQVAHAVILATLDSLARRRGFILMSSNKEASMAIKHLDGYMWHGYRIEVSYAIVQRSGAPIPQAQTVSAIEDKRLSHQASDEQSSALPCGNFSPSPQSSATLLLQDVDTAVISSERFLMALTKPFGQLNSVSLSVDKSIDGIGTAIIRFCCPQSAFFARQALHGLHIGQHSLSVHYCPLHTVGIGAQCSSSYTSGPGPHARNASAPTVDPQSLGDQKIAMSMPSCSRPEVAETMSNLHHGQYCNPPQTVEHESERWHPGTKPTVSVYQPTHNSVYDGSSTEMSELNPFNSMIEPHNLSVPSGLRPIGDERYRGK